eukprot:Em0021g293a
MNLDIESHEGSLLSTASTGTCLMDLSESCFLTDVRVSDQILGRGAYGTVYAGQWVGTKVAIKKLHDIYFEMTASPEGRAAVLRIFARELNLLFQLRHPNIVQFFGVYKASGDGTDITSDTYIVQELMRCSLDQRNRTLPKFNLRNVVDLTLGITSALRYLHERPYPIIHRDLASKNVLLTDSGTPKVADLGVAKMVGSNAASRYTRVPGTELYMPPETRLEGSSYSTLMDVFSLGVILLELCIGRETSAGEPFRLDLQGRGLVTMVPETERRWRDFDELDEHVLKPLILRCLSTQDSRPTSKAVFEQLTHVRSLPAYTREPDVPIFVHPLSPPHLAPANSQHREDLCEVKDLRARLEEVTRENQHLQALLKAQQLPTAALAQLPANLQLRSFSPSESLGDTIEARNQRTRLHMKVAQLEKEKQQEVGLLRAQQVIMAAQMATLEAELTALRKEASLSAKTTTSTSRQDQQGAKPVDDELRKLRKMVEKYKDANIDLDLKLKDARNELQKHTAGQTSLDRSYQHDLERLRQETAELRIQLDSALLDNAHLQGEVALCRRY